jgi:hypothetical protein
MKSSYGNPPVFIPALFMKVLVAVLAAVLVGFVVIYAVMGPLTGVDIAGTLVCAPIVAYLVHLWLAPTEDPG